MAITPMPYRDDDEQDPYQRQSPDGLTVEPIQENEPVRDPSRATEPSRVESQQTPKQDSAPTPQAPRTFKQMQDAGEARPPMPTASPRMPQGPQNVAPETGLPFGVTSEAEIGGKPRATLPPQSIIEPQVQTPVVKPGIAVPGIPELPPAIIEPVETVPAVEGGGEGQPIDAIVEPPQDDLPAIVPSGTVDDTGAESVGSGSSVDLLNMLLEGSQGSDLGSATEQAALAQLSNPSPFNAQAVKDIYGDLGAGIDADYDSRIRGLDESFAARGLYGSAGKDFHSGRLADTELGRRDAKTSMARELAKQYATSYGDYNANAINQGANVSNMDQGNSLDWLRAAMGFGQQGFENDLAVEQLNANQDADYQQLLQMMLAAGYGA